jgi:PAS domain S-box-containing protein
MNAILRILFIEDTESDALLLLREIQRGGYEVQWERVETEEGIRAALTRQSWDMILCDYSMPRMDAPNALKILKRSGLDIPFIIASGTIGEEAAVAALKAGAHDFLIKGKLARLVPAIERELKDARLRNEQKTIQKELHASEERFQKAFRSSPVGMAITRSSDNTYIDANDAFSEITGYSIQELTNQTSLQLNITTADQRQAYTNQIREQGYIHNQEMLLRNKSGEHRLVLGSMEVIELNHEACVLSTAIDITERNQVEERVRLSDQILQRVNALVLVADSQGSIIYVSPSARSILGYEPEELLGDNWWKLSRLESIDAEREKDYLGKTAQGEIPIHVEAYERSVQDKWGQIHWISWMDAAGENNTLIGVGHDITERKQAEELLEVNEQRFRALIENAPDGITLVDRKGIVTYVGPSIERILGYSQDEAFGSNALEFVHPEDRSNLLRKLASLKGKASQALAQYRFQHKDGSWRWLESTISLLKVEPFMEGIVFNYRDITERKHAEETIHQYASELEQRVKERTSQLNQTNIELERANRTKDEFLANMSHELRTPLNSILGLSESLLDQRRDALTGNQERSLQIIEASGRHLLELISDILDLSKIEAGKFDYYPQSINVDELCRSSLSFIKNQAERKSIRLNYSNETTVTEIFADPRRLKQVLINLLTNAVKFTPEYGHVSLEVHAKPGQGLIELSVIDTGIGIAPKDLQRLFTPFVQVDSSLARQFDGTGLGLALAQKLTDLHGGSIAVESEVGKGSRFTINLYIKQGMSNSFERAGTEDTSSISELMNGVVIQPTEQAALSRPKILLAEDNEANILTIGEYLENYDYEILVAHDGAEAVEKAQESNPQIILMDIQMPIMNGLEAMQRLRADSRFSSTPIIALTALAMVGDRERCLAAGATEYMSKPVSLKALREMIEKFLA